MRPYVDFADSKGMLLWVIYGIGYLLSPHTYYGVWVLSCLCYGGILYYNYKTAQLFLGDTRRSLAVAMVMPFFYFQYWFHDDVRAEDFCTLFVSVSLYLMLRVLCSNGYVENVRRTGLVLGGCFMALMMIKFNIAAMQATMILVIIYMDGVSHGCCSTPVCHIPTIEGFVHGFHRRVLCQNYENG